MVRVNQTPESGIFEPPSKLVDDTEQAPLLKQFVQSPVDDAGLRWALLSTGLDVRQGPVEILTQDQKRRAQGIGGRKQEGHRLDRPHAVGRCV